jgi:hypothetical protein
MYEVLICSVVQQLSWKFQRELHCFYWTRMLIAMFSKTWNILYHTVLRAVGNWWSVRDVRLKQHWSYGDAVATRFANGMFCCINTISLAVLLLHLAQCDTEVDIWQQRYIPVSVLSVSHTVAVRHQQSAALSFFMMMRCHSQVHPPYYNTTPCGQFSFVNSLYHQLWY